MLHPPPMTPEQAAMIAIWDRMAEIERRLSAEHEATRAAMEAEREAARGREDRLLLTIARLEQRVQSLEMGGPLPMAGLRRVK